MFSIIDAGQLVLATIACGMIVVLPGVALARLFGFARTPGSPDLLTGIVVGLALLPLVDSLAIRFVGLDPALATTLGLAALGACFCARPMSAPRLSLSAAVCIVIWLVIVLVEWIDIDIAGKLYLPFTVIDAVKHAATVQAILDSGAPPRDAFFLRPEPAGYYYFFYTLAALVVRFCGGLVESRAAVGGLVVWTGIGVYGLIRLAIVRIGRPDRVPPVLIVAILAASGLDIIGVLRMGLLQGTWLADPLSWNEQIAGWLESLLWVPHHVTGLIGGILALIALTDATNRSADLRTRVGAGALASLACASTVGLSVWLMLGLVTAIGLWSVVLLTERRWHALGLTALIGVGAVLVALPQIIDLDAGRAAGSLPIVPTIRTFTPIDGLIGPQPWRDLARLLALPLNYFAGFGAVASGSLIFWKTRASRRATDFAMVLSIAAIGGLLLGAFLKSTIFNNDLGWRVVLYPLFAGTVWTIIAIDDLCRRDEPVSVQWPAVPGFLLMLLGLGWSTSLYALASLRAYPWMSNEPTFAFMTADPEVDRGQRVAYQWANRNLPAHAVLQHDPTRPRAFAFGLYSHDRTSVSDSFGSLYGADPQAVDARIATLEPIFRAALSPAAIRDRAEAIGIDDLVVTRDDPVWSKPGSFVWSATPLYASPYVRIIAVGALGQTPSTTASAR